jgi:Ca-activated chloride channel family protein
MNGLHRTIRVALMLGSLLAGRQVLSADDGERQVAVEINKANGLLRSGDVDGAVKAYHQVQGSAAERADLSYNMAVAQYRKGDVAAAEGLFKQASVSENDALAAKARYNLGNCNYAATLRSAENDHPTAIKGLEKAIENYRSALEIDPNDADSRANIELASAMIDKLREQDKKQQEQQKKDQQQKQDQKNQQNKDKQDQKDENSKQQDKKDSQQQNKDQKQDKDQKQSQQNEQQKSDSSQEKKSQGEQSSQDKQQQKKDENSKGQSGDKPEQKPQEQKSKGQESKSEQKDSKAQSQAEEQGKKDSADQKPESKPQDQSQPSPDKQQGNSEADKQADKSQQQKPRRSRIRRTSGLRRMR